MLAHPLPQRVRMGSSSTHGHLLSTSHPVYVPALGTKATVLKTKSLSVALTPRPGPCPPHCSPRPSSRRLSPLLWPIPVALCPEHPRPHHVSSSLPPGNVSSFTKHSPYPPLSPGASGGGGKGGTLTQKCHLGGGSLRRGAWALHTTTWWSRLGAAAGTKFQTCRVSGPGSDKLSERVF